MSNTTDVLLINPAMELAVYDAFKRSVGAVMVSADGVTRIDMTEDIEQLPVENTHTLKVQHNTKLKGKHAQPFYKKERW